MSTKSYSLGGNETYDASNVFAPYLKQLERQQQEKSDMAKALITAGYVAPGAGTPVSFGGVNMNTMTTPEYLARQGKTYSDAQAQAEIYAKMMAAERDKAEASNMALGLEAFQGSQYGDPAMIEVQPKSSGIKATYWPEKKKTAVARTAPNTAIAPNAAIVSQVVEKLQATPWPQAQKWLASQGITDENGIFQLLKSRGIGDAEAVAIMSNWAKQ